MVPLNKRTGGLFTDHNSRFLLDILGFFGKAQGSAHRRPLAIVEMWQKSLPCIARHVQWGLPNPDPRSGHFSLSLSTPGFNTCSPQPSPSSCSVSAGVLHARTRRPSGLPLTLCTQPLCLFGQFYLPKNVLNPSPLASPTTSRAFSAGLCSLPLCTRSPCPCHHMGPGDEQIALPSAVVTTHARGT